MDGVLLLLPLDWVTDLLMMERSQRSANRGRSMTASGGHVDSVRQDRGVECSFAGLGEVYERVVWPRIELMLVGVALEVFMSADIGRDAALNVLIGAWTDTLAGYTIEDRQLHVLQVQQPVPAEEKLRIVVAVETMAATSEKTAKGKWAQEAEEAIAAVGKAAESALDDLLDDFTGSSGSGEADEASGGAQLAELVTTSSFQEALARQLRHARLLDGALSPRLLSISMVEPPLNTTRAASCPPGMFFSLGGKDGGDAGGQGAERQCLPCHVGSYSVSSGSLTCLECPQGTYAAEEGRSQCSKCKAGTDAASGASSCVECSWFTYDCGGFWEDVVAAVCLGVATLHLMYVKLRRLCVGDRNTRQQNEQMALLVAVRTHGRTLDGVRYESMVGEREELVAIWSLRQWRTQRYVHVAGRGIGGHDGGRHQVQKAERVAGFRADGVVGRGWTWLVVE
ncbi:hypothetical protein BBJ28_00008491 [Nothophytophthora sp. Chile5]|nr:hypothetical protein BBJ28_00008491 [Nothophytophthora sp. Chile5]